jgi:hypothetical protein
MFLPIVLPVLLELHYCLESGFGCNERGEAPFVWQRTELLVTTHTPLHVLGPVPGVDVMAKGPQGWVKCEDRLPYYKDNSCSLPLAPCASPWQSAL